MRPFFLKTLLGCLLAGLSGLPVLTQTQPPGPLHDPGIGPPIEKQYGDVRDGQDWLNPSLSVCADGVHLRARSITRESLIAIQELRITLVRLPVAAWPYGRIIGLQDCSIRDAADQDSGQRLAEVEAVLKALKLQIFRWPA